MKLIGKKWSGWARAVLISAVALRCYGAPGVWNGTWKLNSSKSSIPGPSFTITISPTGEYHVNDGTSTSKFRCDGKEYPTVTHRMILCTRKTSSLMDIVLKENGTKIGTAHWALSADGKMLIVQQTSTQRDGSVRTRENVYSRTSTSRGFAGDWRDTKRLSSRQISLRLDDKSLHVVFVESGQFSDLPLDGSDAVMHGPGVPQGLTMAITPNGAQEFLTVKKFNGEIINQGSLKLSRDGRTLVEEYSRPDKSDERAVLVYERQ
jgi:hypothetical protein